MPADERSLNDIAWEKVFAALPLQEGLNSDGFVFIPADNLKLYGKREPRLMAKLDSKQSRPRIFKNLELSMLPVENGKYVIFKDEHEKSYFSFGRALEEIPIEQYQSRRESSHFDTLQLSKISTESQAIDFAHFVSLLSTFTGDSPLFLTIRGRSRSSDFDIKLPDSQTRISVSGVQIEIDAGFETENSIFILEAKMGKVEDFNIRQLFYPFKNWTTQTSKPVIPLFFTYSNGLFYFVRFEFGAEFGEARIIDKKCFTVNEPPKGRINLNTLLNIIEVSDEPNVPYPQANDLDKVVDLVMNYSEGLNNKESIAEFFEFDERQADYYANAAIYLGLFERDAVHRKQFLITEIGYQLASFPNRIDRNLCVLKQMISRPSFNDILSLFNRNSRDLSLLHPDIVARIIQSRTNLTGTTPRRRASTVKSWVEWVVENMEFE